MNKNIKEEVLKERDNRLKMLGIAKPFLLDGCADPFEVEAYKTLLNRVDKPNDERALVGNIILDLMILSYKDALKKQQDEFLKIIDLYFDMCMGARKVPKKEELRQKVEKTI